MKFSFKNKERRVLGVLDIGSASVKFLIIKKEKPSSSILQKTGKKIIILGKGLKDYERFGVFDGREFEQEVMKNAILGAVEEAEKEAGLEAREVILGLPAHIFKARIVNQELKRESSRKPVDKQEKEKICQKVLKEAEKKGSEEFARESGILPQEICFLSKQILQIKIDGYEVSEMLGFEGRVFEFKTLVTFLPKYYFENIKKLIEICGLSIFKITHEVEGQICFFTKTENTLYLDIGSDFTQMFLVKNGVLNAVLEFGVGGRNFSQALSHKFGLFPKEANGLLWRYQRSLLKEETRARLREVFLREAQNWFYNLDDKLKHKFSFENIFYFGGAAYYPEIEDVLEKNYGLPLKIIEYKDFPNLEDKSKIKRSLQFIPTLFLTYAF